MKRITPTKRQLRKIEQIEKVDYSRYRTFDSLKITFKRGKAMTFITGDTLSQIRRAIPLEFRLNSITSYNRTNSFEMMYVREKHESD